MFNMATIAFAIFWFGFVAIFLVSGLFGKAQHPDGRLFVFIPAGMLLFGLVFGLILWGVGSLYENSMIALLEEILEGTLVECEPETR
jgi:hypothetical protein